jgi:dienelactone hydrolase
MKAHKLVLGAAIAAACGVTLAAEPGERISFVSCPVVRDTTSVPCWISDHEGTTYYLTIQSDVSALVQPPMLGHQVLVEGIVTDQPQICGGVVLDDVRLSVMPEIDRNCNTILPVDERYVVDFNPRPPGPSGGRLAFAAPPDAPEPPPPPQGPQSFDIHFDFDKGVSFRHPGDLSNVMRVANQIKATGMQVTGVRGAHRLSNGQLLQESETVAQRRAEEVAALLQGAGLDLPMRVNWIDGVREADGIDDWKTRRVTVDLYTDPAGSGPEAAVIHGAASLPTHTLYRPAELTGRYPVVLWGNGSCVDSNFGYREFLAELASHGFIVAAIGPWRTTPAPRQQRPADPAEWPAFETSWTQFFDGLDWLAAENTRAGSVFEGHVDTSKVAVMGHSCGGLQTIRASTDPRVSTAVVLNSGMMPTDDDQYMLRHELQRSILKEMHAPIAWFIGGESDIAYANAELDWQDVQALSLPAVNANLPVGHGATYHQPNGGPFAAAPLAWLKWQLKDDAAARAMFVGENCGFCSNTEWQLRRHLP